MTKRTYSALTLVFVPAAAILGCTTPKDDVVPPADDGPPAGDEVGTLPPPENPPDDPDEPVPLESGFCVTKEEPPYEGIRHQCSGSIDIDFSGEALGYAVDQEIFVDFGEYVEGDSYEQARVAACCGPYDPKKSGWEQPGYLRSCLYDAIQQFCVALPYYIWDSAKATNGAGADLLNKLGNDLSTADAQFECIDTLWSGGPAEGDLSLILDRSWNLGYDLWITINILESYDVFLPDDPADWMTCKSIYENDGTVMPDVSPGPVWNHFTLDAGAIKLVNSELEITATADATNATLLIGVNTLGKPVLGDLQLNGGALRVAGVPVERWRLTTLRDVVAVEQFDGSLVVPAGALTFIGAVVVPGETITVPASNATDIVLRPAGGAVSIDPFELVYTADSGDAWTLHTSTLEFSAG